MISLSSGLAIKLQPPVRGRLVQNNILRCEMALVPYEAFPGHSYCEIGQCNVVSCSNVLSF